MYKSIKLAAVGDIALSHKYESLLGINGPDYPFEHIKDFFSQHDIVLANLEAPFCKTGKTYPLKCSLKADPEYVKGLKNAGINIVSLANNHIIDYQEKAMYETIQLLQEHGILYFGAGHNLEEARKPVIIKKNGHKVGFLGYCDVTIDSPFYATKTERGIAPFCMEYAKQDILALRPQVDLLILSIHWGMENFILPSPYQVKTSHQLINLGVDLIIGHHPHVVQRVEKYKDAYIAYSLGNFLFSDIEWTWTNALDQQKISHVKLNKKNKESIVFSCSFNGKLQNLNLLPVGINANHQANTLSAKEKKVVVYEDTRIFLYSIKWIFYLCFKILETYFHFFVRKIKKFLKLANITIYGKN